MLVLGVHYEPSNSNQPQKCEHVVKFLLFCYKHLCPVAFGIGLMFLTNEQKRSIPNDFTIIVYQYDVDSLFAFKRRLIISEENR